MSIGRGWALGWALLELFFSAPKPRLQIDAHVTAVWSGTSDVYILTRDDAREVWLIGGGGDPKARAVREELRRTGRDANDVSFVLVPCGHTTLTAGLRQFTHAPVGAAMDEGTLLWGQRAPGAVLQRMVQRLRGPARVQPQIVPLIAGESLLFGNEALYVVMLPQHTSGSLGFIVRNVLYVGEAADAKATPWRAQLLPGFDEHPAASEAAMREALRLQLEALPASARPDRVLDARHRQMSSISAWLGDTT